MKPDDLDRQPGLLTRIGWFFWANWNRLLCATRGHAAEPNGICARCGMPDLSACLALADAQIESLRAELADERADREAFHRHYLEAAADADALRGEHA